MYPIQQNKFGSNSDAYSSSSEMHHVLEFPEFYFVSLLVRQCVKYVQMGLLAI